MVSRHYELVIFDWDGTLMDSAGAIVYALQAAAVDIGVEPPSEAAARHIIGLGLGDALRHALPNLPEASYGALSERYRRHYLSRDNELVLFDGVQALLDGLAEAQIPLAIATGKSRAGLDRALALTGIGPRFLASRCADECHSKPHPQMLEELMDEFGVMPDRVVMIGDTSHDLNMARNARVDGVAVTYGAHPAESLLALQPVFCADSVAALHAWFERDD